MTSEFESTSTVLSDDDEEDFLDEEERVTYEDLVKLNVSLLKEPGGVISEFLTDFTEGYDRSFQGPIPISVLHKFDDMSGLFKTALLHKNQAGYISLQLNFVDLAELGGLVYFAACGGEEEIILGEKSYEPRCRPLDLAMLDLNEALVRAGGRDNQRLREMFERLGKDKGSEE